MAKWGGYPSGPRFEAVPAAVRIEPPEDDPDVLGRVAEAVRDRRAVSFGYLGTPRRDLHPVALVKRGEYRYLEATDRGGPAPALCATSSCRSSPTSSTGATRSRAGPTAPPSSSRKQVGALHGDGRPRAGRGMEWKHVFLAPLGTTTASR